MLLDVKSTTGYKTVNFDYVKQASGDGKVLIIDVREPCETNNGIIPNSINIPSKYLCTRTWSLETGYSVNLKSVSFEFVQIKLLHLYNFSRKICWRPRP